MRKYVYFGSESLDFERMMSSSGATALRRRLCHTIGDINDDGFDDYAHYYDYQQPPIDHIEVWLGGSPLPTTPAWVLDGPLDGMNYPYRIGEAGDFNGDGIDDWFFSAYHGLEARGRIIVVAGDRNFGLAVNDHSPIVPQEFSLSVFPNPFNSTLSISLDVPLHQEVTLSLYDLLGREVDVVYRGRLSSQTISYVAPAALSSGVYFLRASANSQSVLGKVVLLK
ncbi:MAG: T9SS type A sorting domain-containing protein [bacterium]|nr:T9SS type A sorting domain-containing protein [bacterium]